MKEIVKLMLIILLPMNLWAVHRKVLGELITNTDCGGCRYANYALDSVMMQFPNQFVVVRYHAWWPSPHDPFYSANPDENTARINFYGADYTPHMWIDGTIDGRDQGRFWPPYIQSELNKPTTIRIDMQVLYDSTKNTGFVYTEISNESDSTYNNLHLFYAVTESNIYYQARNGEDIHNQVMRDMIPNATGKAIDVPPNQTIYDTAEFTIDPRWNENNCQIVVFVQDYVTKSVYQAEAQWLFPGANLHYLKYRISDQTGGNNNSVAQPGETVDMYVTLENSGKTTLTGIVATLTTDDSYLSITSSTTGFDTLPIFSQSECPTPFTIQIASNTPDNHFTWLHLTMTTDQDTFVDSIPFKVTNHPGFFDNVENGVGEWTHGGINDYWHITTRKSYSPHHSWYSSDESTHRYTNNMDAYLESPWIVIPANGFFLFFHNYNIANGDVGVIEIYEGNNWVKLRDFSGLRSWRSENFNLVDISGMATKFRFRLLTDSSSVGEGWYIDDVLVGPYTDVQERISPRIKGKIELNGVVSNVLRMNVYSPINGRMNFAIFDASGRLRKSFERPVSAGNNKLEIRLIDLGVGVYFLRSGKKSYRFVVIK